MVLFYSKQIKSNRRRRRLGPSQSTQGLSGSACSHDARLQNGRYPIPRHGCHVYFLWAHGLQHIRHLYHIRHNGSSAQTGVARQSDEGSWNFGSIARLATRQELPFLTLRVSICWFFQKFRLVYFLDNH